MLKYCYLVVEGPHDVAFVSRFLRLEGLSHIQKLSELDSFWKPLVPREFPSDDDLLKRMPVPYFFSSQTHSVAISTAIGDSRIAETLEETFSVINLNEIQGLGIILDADTEKTTKERFVRIKDEIQKKISGIVLPDIPGYVTGGTSLRSGIFIMPDNKISGTLEYLLIQCAEISYKKLLNAADIFINDVTPEIMFYNSKEKKDFIAPAGVNKATIGAIANVLRPGKAVQVSIQDNRWITEETLSIPEIANFNNFIRSLLTIKER